MSDDDPSSGGPGPFLAALVVIAVVLIGIVVATVLSRGSDQEQEGVVRAAIGQNDALQRGDYAAFRANTCAAQAGTEAAVLARQDKSVAERGARYVDNVIGVAVDGERATATVVYHFANAEDDKIEIAAEFTREDGTWRMCSETPS